MHDESTVDSEIDAGPRAAEKIPAGPPGYELIEEIGRGGMGVVYRARDAALTRDVAIKVLAGRHSIDAVVAQRFAHEARITARLQHPAIPAVHQVGILPDGRPFMAMKLIRGATLDEDLEKLPDLAAARGRLLGIFEDVCQAVAYAHAHKVIHRDLKPRNVMVGAFGEVQVMDWGLAKVLGEEPEPSAGPIGNQDTGDWPTQLDESRDSGTHTRAGSLVGTPSYIPPEQALGEIERIDERSDVFGLGALLAVILTGKPPYVGETFEAVRSLAVRGKLEECSARLDACGAEGELIALCKRCLAFDPADRPRDAGEVARRIGELRAAAEERARAAEREQFAAETRHAERRKRRRVWAAAAAALVVAIIGGQAAVLVTRERGRDQLARKNLELLAERDRAQTRFELATKAIASLHTGLSQDALLRNPSLDASRNKILKQAAGFYSDLEKLLSEQSDGRSRQALADAYLQLGELTEKIGDKNAAIAVYRKAVALRRELAAAPGADAQARLELARALLVEGDAVRASGKVVESLESYYEAVDQASSADLASPGDSAKVVLARSLRRLGIPLRRTGKLDDALAAYRRAETLFLGFSPSELDEETRRELAMTHLSIGNALGDKGRKEEALVEYERALTIRRALAEARPEVAEYRQELALTHHNVAVILKSMGKPREALLDYQRSEAIRRKLVDDFPAVDAYRRDLAMTQGGIALIEAEIGRLDEALAEYDRARTLLRRLVDEHPDVADYPQELARLESNAASVLIDVGRTEEGLSRKRQALEIMRKLAADHPDVTRHRFDLGAIRGELGLALARLGRFDEAFPDLDAAENRLNSLHRANPEVPANAEQLARLHAYRGEARAAAGRSAAAAADLRRAGTLWAAIPASSLEIAYEHALAAAVLAGLGSDPRSGVTSTEAASAADRAVAELRSAVAGGWCRPDLLRHRGLDAVRGREDFKTLAAEVEARHRSAPEPRK